MKTAAMILMLVPGLVGAGQRPVGPMFVTRSEVVARHGMAATSQPLATQTALHVLRQGGSAVDAAIAANAVLGLVEPTGAGVGGDLFALVWDAQSGRLHGLNASGRSPRSLALAHFRDSKLESVPAFGALSVSVPGCVDGWFALHERFGRKPMAELLAAAIGYAEEGFPLSEVIAEEWRLGAEKMAEYPGFKEVFMPGGHPPKKGELFRNPGLANTLRRIAEHGRAGFYSGETARIIADYMKRQGGFLSETDLAEHRSEWVAPVSSNYRGYDVWELPPNGQGIAALQILNIMEGYDVKAMGFGSPTYLHHFIEAKKLAFEDRARFYADPAFSRLPVQRLISKEYAADRRKRIDPKRAAETQPPGDLVLEHGDTVYLTVADERGNMVSLIQSNYRGFGSGMTPEGLGFVLQNRGALFSLDEAHPNCFAPGKRPFHTIIPAFVTREGKPWISFGVMGGAMQPQGHAQVIMNLIDFGMGLQEAGDAPRVQHVGSSEPTGETMTDGGEVWVEFGFPEETVRDLVELGHTVGHGPVRTFGGYQAICVEQGVYFGASESRKDGHAAGY